MARVGSSGQPENPPFHLGPNRNGGIERREDAQQPECHPLHEEVVRWDANLALEAGTGAAGVGPNSHLPLQPRSVEVEPFRAEWLQPGIQKGHEGVRVHGVVTDQPEADGLLVELVSVPIAGPAQEPAKGRWPA